jgi:hypothetical protein
MGCTSFIYEERPYGYNSDLILRLKQTVDGYNFGEDLMDCFEGQYGYQYVLAEQLGELFDKHNIKPEFELDEDRTFLVYISY